MIIKCRFRMNFNDMREINLNKAIIFYQKKNKLIFFNYLYAKNKQNDI